MKNWETLFHISIDDLRNSNIPYDVWAIGGSSAIYLKFSHRKSKDLDIFIYDPQFLNYISPRLNDLKSIEKLLDYEETEKSIKIRYNEGKIDYVINTQISNFSPIIHDFENWPLQVEHPIEVITKKIYYRSHYSPPRDIFDIAFIFSKYEEELLKIHPQIFKKINAFENQINITEKSKTYDNFLKETYFFDEGKKILGYEFKLCREFIDKIRKLNTPEQEAEILKEKKKEEEIKRKMREKMGIREKTEITKLTKDKNKIKTQFKKD